MKDDNELREDVEDELEWEPSVDERRIGVAVVDGVVTLTGEVSSLAERWNAERAVERVAGVRGIANELEVKRAVERSDTDIAAAAADALAANVVVPPDRVKVKVRDAWVTLTGELDWDYQRRAAERAVRNLPGVRGITNLISVKPRVQPTDIKRRLEETFKREAALDANRIRVQTSDGEVTLRGSVRSWVERREAEKAAWAAPGVTAVHNQITVDPALAA
ncbi:MAG TPA: BON domain-containing protein [Acidimicrobiales bacterium]|jgi:osmotically-inducible protein OsmY|nr:BON domain-containing protein [Acidimicrobiales bacterium]